MNILTIVILAIFLLFAWSGFSKNGLIRKLAGIVFAGAVGDPWIS